MTDEEATEFFKNRGKQLVEGIDLVDEVRVRRISKEDLEDLQPRRFPFPHDLREFVSPRMFVLEKYVTVKERHDFQPTEVMRNIVLALRLLKEGYVYGNCVFYILVSERRQLSSWSREQPTIIGPPRAWMPYALNFEEIPALKKLLNKIQGVDFSGRKSLHLACKRFQRAYEESEAEDQLIDLMIAFEALFLRGEKSTRPAGQIIAIACSVLLGENDEEREEIKNLLTRARSSFHYL